MDVELLDWKDRPEKYEILIKEKIGSDDTITNTLIVGTNTGDGVEPHGKLIWYKDDEDDRYGISLIMTVNREDPEKPPFMMMTFWLYPTSRLFVCKDAHNSYIFPISDEDFNKLYTVILDVREQYDKNNDKLGKNSKPKNVFTAYHDN